jgi:hypothetical protein
MDASTKAYSRQVPLDRHLRASDRDRDAVAELLRKAHAAGRIDTDEFADRFGRCLEAKTYAELDQLIADLPASEDVAAPGRWRAPAWHEAQAPAGWRGPWGPWWWRGLWGPARQWGAGDEASPRSPFPLWPVAAFVFMWAVIAFAVLAAAGGHLVWLVFPLVWFFGARRSGRRQSRCSGSDRQPPGSGRTWGAQ